MYDSPADDFCLSTERLPFNLLLHICHWKLEYILDLMDHTFRIWFALKVEANIHDKNNGY